MKKNRIEENKTDKHLAEKNQIEKNLIVDRLTVTYGESWQLTVSAFLFLPGKFTLLSARVVLENRLCFVQSEDS